VNPLSLDDLGPIEYADGLNYQLKTVDEVANGHGDTVILCSHPYQLTSGVRSRYLALDTDLEVVKVRRGGLITFHYPGQLVLYPIFNLRRLKIKKIIELIFGSLIKVLEDYGLKASLDWKSLGLWMDNKKIACCGMGIYKFCSYHGMSINILRDDFFFAKIRKIPFCGMDFSCYQTVGDYKTVDYYDFKVKLKGHLMSLWPQ
jgi:lipoyl(octanoyl) transferase